MVNFSSKIFLRNFLFCFVLPVSAFFVFILFSYQLSHQCFLQKYLSIKPYNTSAPILSDRDPCAGRYIYLYDLPPRFNSELVQNCRNLSNKENMCKAATNSGQGPKLSHNSDTGSVLPETGWYSTHQYVLEIIFHGRMKQYECLTTDYSKSTAVYLPFYFGLDIMRYLWGYSTSTRDTLTNELVHWLRARPEWAARGGRDHFSVCGRPSWDFLRHSNLDKDWGSKFMSLPEAKNMTLLSVETTTWQQNEFGLVYPTYFHPSKESQVLSWQERVRSTERPWLFSFAGARRPAPVPSTRDLIIDQCANSTQCKLQECGSGAKDCYSPSNILRVFMSSIFCLQPTGDSFTRRSAFDSMLAGCIPVFFHPATAYMQYQWYLPSNYNKFSVYITEKAVREGAVRIEDVLLGYSDEQIREMRGKVIEMIPTLVYKDLTTKYENFRDAFDVAVDAVLERNAAAGFLATN